MAASEVEVFFDVSSPWTYLGFTNVQPLAAGLGIGLRWRPILVGAIFNAVNPSVYRSRDEPVPAKDAYVAKDLADWARATGIAIRWRPRVFPVNSARAMRGCIVAGREGKLVPFARRVFEAYWGEDRDIADPAVLGALAAELGLAPEAFLAAADAPDVKAEFRANNDELIRRGGFGSPTFFLGDDMYFGNDRLPLLRLAVERRRARGDIA